MSLGRFKSKQANSNVTKTFWKKKQKPEHQPASVNKSHLYVVFNEARGLHTSLHVEADVHLHLCFLVGQLDDRNLKREKPLLTLVAMEAFYIVNQNETLRINYNIILEISTVQQFMVHVCSGAFNDRTPNIYTVKQSSNKLSNFQSEVFLGCYSVLQHQAEYL